MNENVVKGLLLTVSTLGLASLFLGKKIFSNPADYNESSDFDAFVKRTLKMTNDLISEKKGQLLEIDEKIYKIDKERVELREKRSILLADLEGLEAAKHDLEVACRKNPKGVSKIPTLEEMKKDIIMKKEKALNLLRENRMLLQKKEKELEASALLLKISGQGLKQKKTIDELIAKKMIVKSQIEELDHDERTLLSEIKGVYSI